MDFHVWLSPPWMQGNINSGPHDCLAKLSPKTQFVFFSLEKNVYLGCFPILKSEHCVFGIDFYELQEVSKIWLYDRLDVYRMCKRIQQTGEF